MFNYYIMPPKRRRKKQTTTQTQRQKQSIVVNIGASNAKAKRQSGRGGLPPPSHMHNLAPTFVTQQPTDYTPIINAIAGLTSKINETNRVPHPVTPLSSTVQASTSAQQMAGESAIRRAGQTAGNFQEQTSLGEPPPITRSTTEPPLRRARSIPRPPPPPPNAPSTGFQAQTERGTLRESDPYYRETLLPTKGLGEGAFGEGGGAPISLPRTAAAVPKKGRPFGLDKQAEITVAEPIPDNTIFKIKTKGKGKK